MFIRDPQFQSQTKDRLTSPEAARLVENAVRDHFDHFLSDNMERGKALLGAVMERMDERLRRKAETALGAKFDVRAFHEQVLGSGALPLPVLEAKIDRWIAGQR